MAIKSFISAVVGMSMVLFAAQPSSAQGWYFDAGLEFVDVGGDLSAVDTGLGIALELGFEFAPGAALNFGLGSSGHTEGGRDLSYTRFWIGPRVTFQAGTVKPYVETGIMGHFMDYETAYYYQYPYYYEPYPDYGIDGTGLYLGGGLLFPISTGGAAGFYMNFSDWEGEGSSGMVEDRGDVSTSIIGFNFIWGF